MSAYACAGAVRLTVCEGVACCWRSPSLALSAFPQCAAVNLLFVRCVRNNNAQVEEDRAKEEGGLDQETFITESGLVEEVQEEDAQVCRGCSCGGSSCGGGEEERVRQQGAAMRQWLHVA